MVAQANSSQAKSLPKPSPKQAITTTVDVNDQKCSAGHRADHKLAIKPLHFTLIVSVGLLVVICLASGWRFSTSSVISSQKLETSTKTLNVTACPQVSSIRPIKCADIDHSLDQLYHEDEFRKDAFQHLGRAVQIPTESYDDLQPVGQDPRWIIFGTFHHYLQSSFPLVYRKLIITRVNTYALVFHWQGSDDSLKPILLTAHIDVVPVDPSTVEQWIHPPYSGFYDGEYIWGRGSIDDKADLISQLIAIDSLLKAGFEPRRTIVLASGIDEEATGHEGAGHLAPYLESTYGRDGFSILIDEGDGFAHISGREGREVIIAMPTVSEKGYTDVRIEVSTNGGHSSVPPAHTSIGILSAIVVHLEDNPHPPRLSRDGTPFALVQCAAEYSPVFPPHLKDIAEKALHDDEALELLKRGLLQSDDSAYYTSILTTSQAVDLIRGGVKANALPEGTEAVVNHRIAQHSSVAELQDHLTSLIRPMADQYRLSLTAFGKVYNVTGGSGEIVLTDAFNVALEPSPVSPTGPSDGPYQLLSGTIKATIQSERNQYVGSQVVVTPTLMVGNTDTVSYWNLTRHNFRYSHRSEKAMYNDIHTVNEAVRAEDFIQQIRFFTKFILNADESSLL